MSDLKYYKNGKWNIVNGNIVGDTLPIGAIVPYGSTTAPTNWLICDGTEYSIDDYPELYAKIGNMFGGDELEGTFAVPNFKGRFPIGRNINDSDFINLGQTGGSKTHTQTRDEVANHTHQLWVTNDSGDSYGNSPSIQWSRSRDSWTNTQFGVERTDTQNASPMNIMNPYQVVNYIIKVKQSAGVVANVSNTYSTSQSDTYSCDFINDCNTYSTSETFTGKYWWDNSPIYRKVIYMAEPTSYENIATGVNSANIIWYDGIVSTGGGYINKINSTEWDANYRITGDIDPSGYFRFRAGGSQTQLANLNVIIEYTK